MFVGNNITYNVVGIGNVTFKTYDGVMRTLANPRHILDLQRNFISLGILDGAGYKSKVEGGVMRISWGAFIVIKGTPTLMKGMKQNSQFIL